MDTITNPNETDTASNDWKINQIIKKADDNILAVMNGTYGTDAGSVAGAGTKTGSSSAYMLANLGITGFLMATIGVFHGLFKLHLQKYEDIVSWIGYVTVFSIIYIGCVALLHIYALSDTKISNITIMFSALAPVLIVLGLLKVYPSFSGPFDNTIGYAWANSPLFGLTETMKHFQSRFLTEDTMAKFNINIPFNWLITTMSLENYEEMLEQIGGVTVDPNKVRDFYIDIDINDDLYSNFKNELKAAIDRKQSVGHLFCVLSAAAIGGLGSLLISTII